MKGGTLGMVAMLLVSVGAINWGLKGLLDLNLVESLLGAGSLLEKVVYILIGVSGVWMLWKQFGGSK